jgi:hypothetical protein
MVASASNRMVISSRFALDSRKEKGAGYDPAPFTQFLRPFCRCLFWLIQHGSVSIAPLACSSQDLYLDFILAMGRNIISSAFPAADKKIYDNKNHTSLGLSCSATSRCE